MSERLPQTNERSFTEKAIGKGLFVASFITLPIGLYIGGTALLAGAFAKGAIALGAAVLDIIQIREHGKPPEQQSRINPERLLGRLFGLGSNRLKHTPTSSMVYAAS